jgi:hypothetical protein
MRNDAVIERRVRPTLLLANAANSPACCRKTEGRSDRCSPDELFWSEPIYMYFRPSLIRNRSWAGLTVARRPALMWEPLYRLVRQWWALEFLRIRENQRWRGTSVNLCSLYCIKGDSAVAIRHDLTVRRKPRPCKISCLPVNNSLHQTTTTYGSRVVATYGLSCQQLANIACVLTRLTHSWGSRWHLYCLTRFHSNTQRSLRSFTHLACIYDQLYLLRNNAWWS